MDNTMVDAARDLMKQLLPEIADMMDNICDLEQFFDKYNAEHGTNFDVQCGSARMCLVCDTFVIKWDYDSDSVDEIGGCWDECAAYQTIKDSPFAYLFAEAVMFKIGWNDFEVMPRIKNVGYKPTAIATWLTNDEFRFVTDVTSDLHSYNWGIVNNKPCIIDYALTEDVRDRASTDW